MSTREQDQALEVQIIGLGLNAPRVALAHIDALVEALSYHTYVVPGTTTTVACAIAPGEFVVAIGKAAAVSPENFREQLGRDAAIANAKGKAREKLWELEGWRLKRNLRDLHEAGLLEQTLNPELLAAVGDEWPAAAIPAAVVRAVGLAPCSRCASSPSVSPSSA